MVTITARTTIRRAALPPRGASAAETVVSSKGAATATTLGDLDDLDGSVGDVKVEGQCRESAHAAVWGSRTQEAGPLGRAGVRGRRRRPGDNHAFWVIVSCCSGDGRGRGSRCRRLRVLC
ncbi:exported hypothetical protein [Frankia sp. AgKG'84/4]